MHDLPRAHTSHFYKNGSRSGVCVSSPWNAVQNLRACIPFIFRYLQALLMNIPKFHYITSLSLFCSLSLSDQYIIVRFSLCIFFVPLSIRYLISGIPFPILRTLQVLIWTLFDENLISTLDVSSWKWFLLLTLYYKISLCLSSIFWIFLYLIFVFRIFAYWEIIICKLKGLMRFTRSALLQRQPRSSWPPR